MVGKHHISSATQINRSWGFSTGLQQLWLFVDLIFLLFPRAFPSSSLRVSAWLTRVHPMAWAGRFRTRSTASMTWSWSRSWWSGSAVSVALLWGSQKPENWASRPGWRMDAWVYRPRQAKWVMFLSLCARFSSFDLDVVFSGPWWTHQQLVCWGQTCKEDPELAHGFQTDGADLTVPQSCRKVWRHQDRHVPDCGPLGRSESFQWLQQTQQTSIMNDLSI